MVRKKGVDMNQKKILQELEKIAEQLGARIIFDKIEGKGGYCRCYEEKYIVVNKLLNIDYKIDILAEGIRELPFEEIYIKPEIRKILDFSYNQSKINNGGRYGTDKRKKKRDNREI